MNTHDEPERSLPSFSENISAVPAFLNLRGTFFFPGPQEYASQGDSSMERSFQGRNRHAVPVDRDHLMVHTESSVTLYHLPTRTALWTIESPSFHFALDSRRSLLALTPQEPVTYPSTTLSVWDLHTGSILHQLSYTNNDQAYEIIPNSLAFSPDGCIVAAGMESEWETLIALWDTTDGHLLRTLETGDYADITTLTFHPLGNLLAGGSFKDDQIWFWNLDDGHRLNVWELDCSDRPYDLAFNPDGTFLFAACGTCGLHVWDVRQAREVLDPELGPGGNKRPCRITLAPDGQLLAMDHSRSSHFGDRIRTVRILEIGTWRMVHEFAGHYPSESFSLDGQLLATIEEDGPISVWQVATGELLSTL